MKHIKKFDSFNEDVQASPQTAPTKPQTRPDVRPGKPETRPSRPSPIPGQAPKVDPLPKAKESTKKSNEDDVTKRFIYELKRKGEEKVDMSIDYLKNKYTQVESLSHEDQSVIADFENLVAGDYTKEEAYQEVIGSYDEDSLTPEVLAELDKLRKS